MLVVLVGGGGGYVAWERFSANLPDVDGLRNYQPPVMSRVYAGDARLMAELATERRIFVPYSAIPDMVKQAFVSAEDQNFWTHPGVDPLAIARAGVFDLTHMGQGRRPIGASTITQQVAKNMLLDSEVSLARKAREAILAMRIEKALTEAADPRAVPERDLSRLGLVWRGRGGAGVFQQAAGQADAVRSGVPRRAAEGAEQLQSVQLPRCREGAARLGGGSDGRGPCDHAEQASAAKAEPIVPAEFHRPQPIPGADWFAEEVRRELIARFGADVTTQGGLMVRTSLDPALQVAAEKSVRDGLMAYDRKMGGWRGPVTHLDAGPGWRRIGRACSDRWRGRRGMLPDWQLAVVLSETDTEARLGWLEPSEQATSRHSSVPARCCCRILHGRGR